MRTTDKSGCIEVRLLCKTKDGDVPMPVSQHLSETSAKILEGVHEISLSGVGCTLRLAFFQQRYSEGVLCIDVHFVSISDKDGHFDFSKNHKKLIRGILKQNGWRPI